MKKKRKWIISIIIILIIFSFVSVNFFNYKFTRERWQNNPDIRYKMIDNLEREYFLKGKTKQEVMNILGEPDKAWENNVKEGHYDYFQYYIGPKDSIFAIMHEPDIYLISFCEDVVVGTSVQPT